LDKLIALQPEAQLLVLSEYTFHSPVPENIKRWCRKHERYLIVGGEDEGPRGDFYNTAFVVGPTGDVVFRQVKSVPIQFFKDGLPAHEQAVWNSPWGKLGICICYDLSYTRVTDRLVRMGAQGLIVPTMDVIDWGQRQHELHALVAPTRAAEYGVPIFRLASSGISQCIGNSGKVISATGCPAQGDVLSGTMRLGAVGELPLDRGLAPFSTGVSGVLFLFFIISEVRSSLRPGARLNNCEAESEAQA
jgi:predicted amidohydrolase